MGSHGASAVREIALFAARNHKAQVEGAFTTRTPVNQPSMNKVINGTNAGSAACGGNLPGVVVDVGMPLPCNDSNSDGDCTDPNECNNIDKVTGSTCAQIFDPTQPGKRPLPKTPWDALGLTEVDFRSLVRSQVHERARHDPVLSRETHESLVHRRPDRCEPEEELHRHPGRPQPEDSIPTGGTPPRRDTTRAYASDNSQRARAHSR